MKQTKKLTRGQREYLQKKGVNTDDLRLVQETRTEIICQTSNGEKVRYEK